MNQLEGTTCPKCHKGKLHYSHGNLETAIYKCDSCDEEIPTDARVITPCGPMKFK